MTFSFDPTQVVGQLRRIADALDRAFPFIPPERLTELRRRGPESIINYGDNDKIWLRQTFQGLIHERGLAPDQEKELLEASLAEYDDAE